MKHTPFWNFRSHLTDVIMLKQGQQANITAAFDSLEESHISFARVQLDVIIKDIRNRSTTHQQVDQLLKTGGKKML